MGRVGEGGGLRLERKREETVSTNTENNSGTFCCHCVNMHMHVKTIISLPRTLKHSKEESDGFAACALCLRPLRHRTALPLVHSLGVVRTRLPSRAAETIEAGITIPVFSGVSPSLDSHGADSQARFRGAGGIREGKPAAPCPVGPTGATPTCLNLRCEF